MTDDPTSVEVRALIARKGLTIAALAPCAGMTPTALYRRVQGRAPWSVADVRAVAAALGVTAAELVPEKVTA